MRDTSALVLGSRVRGAGLVGAGAGSAPEGRAAGPEGVLGEGALLEWGGGWRRRCWGGVGPDSVYVVVGVGFWGVRGRLALWAVEE